MYMSYVCVCQETATDPYYIMNPSMDLNSYGFRFSMFSMLSITFGEFVLPCGASTPAALAGDESSPCSHILKSPPPARPFFKDLRKSSSTPRCQRFG